MPCSAIAAELGPLLFEKSPHRFTYVDVAGQPKLLDLSKWDDKIVAETSSGYYSLSLPAGTWSRLRILDFSKVMALATSSNPVALCSKKGEIHLLMKMDGNWREIALPLEARVVGNIATICADERSLVLVGSDRFFLYTGEHGWQMIPAKKPAAIAKVLPKYETSSPPYVLHEGKIYLGLNWFEHGGGVFEFDLNLRHWRQLTQFDRPIQSMKIDKVGRLWIAQATSPKDGYYHRAANTLWRKDDDRWNSITAARQSTGKQEPGLMLGMAFESKDPFLLISRVGVISWNGSNWARLTPTWKEEPFYLGGLEVKLPFFILGTHKGGVLLYNTRTKQFKRTKFV